MCPCLSAGEVKRDHCNKTVDIYEDVSSPEVTPEIWGRPMTCWYRFRSFRGTPKDWILRIRFKKFKVGTLLNATHCHGGYMQVSTFFFIVKKTKEFFNPYNIAPAFMTVLRQCFSKSSSGGDPFLILGDSLFNKIAEKLRSNKYINAKKS